MQIFLENILPDEKFFDVFSEDPHGTKVILTNESSGITEWVGYLTSNLLNMPENSCGPETFTLEAQDCIYTLEHYKYEPIISKERKQIVSFKDILKQIATKCEQIDELIIDRSVEKSNGAYIHPSALTISAPRLRSRVNGSAKTTV